MKNCPKCGSKLEENQKFCTKCGFKIDDLIKKNELSPETLAQIDILQKKISNDNLNNLLYNELGNIYFENEMYNKAILEYQKAFTIDNRNFDSIFKTAEAYRKIKEFTKAESSYTKALELDNNAQKAKLGLFWCYYFQDKIEDLINLEKGINDDIKKLDFHEAMKEAFKKTDNPESAFEEMEKIFKLVPENIDNLRDLAEYYYDRDDYNKSIEFYKKILLIDPNDIDSIFIIGKDYCYKKDYNKTIELFESNLTNFPDELVSLIYFYLSYSYLKLENTYKAIEMIQNVDSPNIKSISSRDKKIIAETFFELSENLVKSNNLSPATKYLENAIRYESDNQKIIDKSNQVKKLYTVEYEKIKKKKTKNIKLSIFAIICISILTIVIFRLINIQKDNTAWETAKERNSIESYSTYLSEYTKGKFKLEATEQLEKSIWLRSKKENNVEAFEIYLKNYPEGIFVQEAKDNLESQIWKNAKSQNTIESYSFYLSKYPNGKFEKDATISYKEIFLEDNVLVNGGTFRMGTNNGDNDEKPIHNVTLDSFYISKYEVTNKEYVEFLNAVGVKKDGLLNGENFLNLYIFYSYKSYNQPYAMDYENISFFCTSSYYENCAVEAATWLGANAFCKWKGGRLPTEAEWEFAAKGGNQSKNYKYSGSNNIKNVASRYRKYGPEKVGLKLPNEIGIYDMSGNISEWCYDWYNFNYYSTSPENNPQGPSSGVYRVKRDGVWDHTEKVCRVTHRGRREPKYSSGFRIAYDLK